MFVGFWDDFVDLGYVPTRVCVIDGTKVGLILGLSCGFDFKVLMVEGVVDMIVGSMFCDIEGIAVYLMDGNLLEGTDGDKECEVEGEIVECMEGTPDGANNNNLMK